MRRLIVNPETEHIWEIPLDSSVISLGRDLKSGFPIEHSSVAAEHCLVTVMDSGVVVKNLTPDNRTFIDGKMIDEALLLPGQTLQLGDVIMRFEADATSIKPSPPCATSLPATSENPTFAKLASGAFLYPFRHDGLILLVAGTVFYVVINFLSAHAPFVGFVVMIFGTGYLFNYLQRILQSSAMGENKIPDWPDFSDWSDVSGPFFQTLGVVLFSFGPFILISFLAPTDAAWKIWAELAALAWGCVYFPMSFTAVALFDSLAALNPLLIFPSILKTAGAYLLAVILSMAIFAAVRLGSSILDIVLPIPFLSVIISQFAGLYLLTVEVRILGLLYWAKQDELGWFQR